PGEVGWKQQAYLFTCLSSASFVRRGLLQARDVVEQIGDLVGLKSEDRHCRVADYDALGKRFGQMLDRIFLAEHPEGRRRSMPTWSGRHHGMALGAVLLDEHAPAINTRRILSACSLRKHTDPDAGDCDDGAPLPLQHDLSSHLHVRRLLSSIGYSRRHRTGAIA